MKFNNIKDRGCQNTRKDDKLAKSLDLQGRPRATNTCSTSLDTAQSAGPGQIYPAASARQATLAF